MTTGAVVVVVVLVVLVVFVTKMGVVGCDPPWVTSTTIVMAAMTTSTPVTNFHHVEPVCAGSGSGDDPTATP